MAQACRQKEFWAIWWLGSKMAGRVNISRERKEDGIVQILEDAFTIKKIENTYRQIKIRDVSQDMDFSTCFVKGKDSAVSANFGLQLDIRTIYILVS